EVTLEKLSKLTAGSSFLLYVTLLAAVKVCLYKYNRNHVVTVGGPPRGVEAEYPEPAHVLAIVDKIERGMSFRTLLLNVKETVAEAYQFQNYPLRDFVTDLEVGDETQLQPQVLLAVKDFHGDIPPLKSDITLRFERVGAEIRGVVDFDYGLFSPDIIQQFTCDLPHILSLALQDTSASINEISALTPAQQQQLLSEWNNTSRHYPESHCVDELFALQVDRVPEAVAIIYDDQHLTYSELNRRANQLAGYLRMLGVGPEKRVALYL